MKKRKQESSKSSWKEWGKSLILGLAIAMIFKVFLFTPFEVDGASMEPTLQNHDRLLVNKISLYTSGLQRGDVIIIKKENDPKHYVKRIVGLEGDTVQLVDGQLYVNGRKQSESYLDQAQIRAYKEYLNLEETVVPAHKIFVMGDNRPDSTDSRNGLGFIDVSEVIGKTKFVFYPFDRLKSVE